MVDPLSYFSFQPVIPDWCNKGCGMSEGVAHVAAAGFLSRYLNGPFLNTFYLRLYLKDHSDNERGNPLPPHGILFPINSKGHFVFIIPQTE